MADRSTPRRRLARPSAGTVVMVVTVLLGVTVLAPSVQQFVAQRQRVADLQEHIATVEGQIASLEVEQARWSDPAYVQAQARGRLLFVKPGETTYLVTDTPGGAPPQEPVAARPDMYETETDWVATLAQSFATSGLANAPGAPAEPAPPTAPAPPASASPTDAGTDTDQPAEPGATP